MKKALLLVLGSIVSVQLGAAAAKSLFPEVGPLAMAWLRFTGATVILVFVGRISFRGHSRRAWLDLLVYCASLACMNVLFYQGVARIPLGLAVTIEFLGPLGVALAKTRRARDLLWVVLAGAGVALLGWSPGSLNWAGVGFILGAAVCWTTYILVTPRVGKQWGGAQAVTYANILGALSLVIPVLMWHRQGLGSWHIWVLGLVVGLLSSVVPYVFELQALKTIEPRIFSILMSAEPAMAALAGLVILGEHLSATDVVAMGCVVAASVGVTWTATRGKPKISSGAVEPSQE
ncbi:MAG: EamA family transporter [Propionibacteriaceae bacterium]|nr:EamA family transporter [Propionibacteriaceae bacterium]